MCSSPFFHCSFIAHIGCLTQYLMPNSRLLQASSSGVHVKLVQVFSSQTRADCRKSTHVSQPFNSVFEPLFPTLLSTSVSQLTLQPRTFSSLQPLSTCKIYRRTNFRSFHLAIRSRLNKVWLFILLRFEQWLLSTYRTYSDIQYSRNSILYLESSCSCQIARISSPASGPTLDHLRFQATLEPTYPHQLWSRFLAKFQTS